MYDLFSEICPVHGYNMLSVKLASHMALTDKYNMMYCII